MITTNGLVTLLGTGLHTGFFFLLAILSPESFFQDSNWFAFVAIVVGGSAVEALMTMDACHRRDDHGREQTVAQLVGALIVIGFVAAHWERASWVTENHGFALAGLSMLLLGFGLRLWAIAVLGQDFQTRMAVPETVVTTGPYRWMKHPAEVGMVILAVGGPLSLGSWRTSLLIVVSLTPFAAWRIRKENRMLQRARCLPVDSHLL